MTFRARTKRHLFYRKRVAIAVVALFGAIGVDLAVKAYVTGIIDSTPPPDQIEYQFQNIGRMANKKQPGWQVIVSA